MIEITEKHRSTYSKYYRCRKTTSIGYNILNESVIKILKDLTELGYLRFVREKTELVKFTKDERLITYAYYKSTGLRMPNLKHNVKMIKHLYTVDGKAIKLIPCQMPKGTGRKWDCDNLIINDEKFACDISSNNYKYTIYFQYKDNRWYKFNEYGSENWNILCTHVNKLSLERSKKLDVIFSD